MTPLEFGLLLLVLLLLVVMTAWYLLLRRYRRSLEDLADDLDEVAEQAEAITEGVERFEQRAAASTLEELGYRPDETLEEAEEAADDG